MGEVSHGLKFARKLRLNLDTLPLVVDSGPTFPLYAALGLHNEPSLAALYTNTVNARSILSASRSLVRGFVPTYDEGGSLTQLGGTFVIQPGTAGQPPRVLYSHVDTHTGVHAPLEDVIRALRSAERAS